MPDSELIPPAFSTLLERKKFAEMEEEWVRRVEAGDLDLPSFFAVAAAAKKKGHGAGAVGWLRLLADELGGRNDFEGRMRVLLELARMAPTDASVRSDLDKALRERFAGHPALSLVLTKTAITSAPDPAAAAGKIERWLRFAPGDVYHLPGRGPGRIVEMNPALDVLRFEVGGAKLPLSLVSAERSLEPIPEGHFLRDKLLRPEELKALAASDPSEAVRRLLASLGRPVTLGELKEHFAGIVDESRWTSFWTAAKKHPQLLVSGSAKSGKISWSESAGAADESIRAAFLSAEPRKQIELARKHGKRSKGLAQEFADRLAKEASNAAPRDPALAWELSQTALRMVPSLEEPFTAAQLLASPDVPGVISRIHDSSAREKALQAVRASSEGWADLFAEQFHREDDSRVLAYIFQELGATGARRDEIARRILRSPRSAPRAFVWLAERLHEENAPATPALFLALVDALRQDEFSALRARLKEFFDPGNLAVRLVQGATEEEGREYLTALTRASGLEEHRRSVVREALLMRFPDLRAPAREYLYGTAESIEARRQELIRLKQVDLPAN
ncbi:MAG TPA: hypothetical protein VE007_02695, partial [Thermoanaerobaculia bacterium]|nr:hypothetical protein [Thermoanaerobaculia bacterium]